MNLKELKESIDWTIENLQSYQKPEDITVAISLSESSIGDRASTTIKYVGMGIDWESGQFRIEPVKSIVSKGNTIKDPKEKYCRNYEGRNYYFCSRCEGKISKDDKFCRECGQSFKIRR